MAISVIGSAKGNIGKQSVEDEATNRAAAEATKTIEPQELRALSVCEAKPGKSCTEPSEFRVESNLPREECESALYVCQNPPAGASPVVCKCSTIE